MNCGYGEKLILYSYGEAGEALSAEVAAHLAACPACRSELAALKAAAAGLGGDAGGPSPWVIPAVMREARARAARPRALGFKWGELLLSGAAASMLAFFFAFSGRGASPELAWNSGIDTGLDSFEYSMYQAQSDLISPQSDWEYGISALEDETLDLGRNV